MADITYANKDKTALDGRQIFTDADANMVKAAVNSKVDKVQGKGLSTNDFTNPFKQAIETLHTTFLALVKVKQEAGQSIEDVMSQKAVTDAINNLQDQITAYTVYYKGSHLTLAALQAAHPTSIPGAYAQVNAGAGSNAIHYSWDAEEGWIVTSTPGPVSTDFLTEGINNLYFTVARVLSAPLSTVAGGSNTQLAVGMGIQQAILNLQAQLNAIGRETAATVINVTVSTTSYTLAQRPNKQHCVTDLMMGGRNAGFTIAFTMVPGDTHIFNVVNEGAVSFPFVLATGVKYGGSTTQTTTIGAGEIWEFMAVCKTGGRVVISTLGKEKTAI